ncbi:hypothetical protein BDV93DRAFT_63011 [Ceratobasidium sp. AG-I]|nr:hypothetical protein BDV93DRAFT_63011 [Ceratobasidium sp. AG-I]
MSVDEARPRIPLQRQNTEQILSYYLNAGADIDDGDNGGDDRTATLRRPSRPGAPPENRRLHIVELDGQHDLSRRFDRSRLALVAPPETAAAAPDTMDLAPPQTSTPIMTPPLGESKHIGTKVAPPVLTRLGSQETWLPPSPTKAAERSVSPRGAPPPRPPRLSSPPPRGSPAQSFNSLASVSVSVAAPERRRVDEETRLVPAGAPMIRGNSDYSIMAVSDSSERSTPKDEVSEPTSPTLFANGGGSSHRREGGFPAHSVFTSQSASRGDGLPSPTSTDERTFYLNGKPPLRVVGESEDEDLPERRGSPSRSNTITSRSTRSDTITASSPSNYTPLSSSNYTSSNVSRTATQDNGGNDMLDLIATVGSALHDLGLDPADVPPATVFPPPDDAKPTPAASRKGSIDNLRSTSLDGPGFRSSPRGSTVNLVRQANGSPSTSRAGSPRADFRRVGRRGRV